MAMDDDSKGAAPKSGDVEDSESLASNLLNNPLAKVAAHLNQSKCVVLLGVNITPRGIVRSLLEAVAECKDKVVVNLGHVGRVEPEIAARYRFACVCVCVC